MKNQQLVIKNKIIWIINSAINKYWEILIWQKILNLLTIKENYIM